MFLSAAIDPVDALDPETATLRSSIGWLAIEGIATLDELREFASAYPYRSTGSPTMEGARELAEADPRWFVPFQYANPANVRAATTTGQADFERVNEHVRAILRTLHTYGHAIEVNGRVWLQYWLWYPYNVYSPTVPPGELWQSHEGDWEVVNVILGERWEEAIPVIRLLAWVGLLQSLQGLNSSILQARDRTRLPSQRAGASNFKFSCQRATVHVLGLST